MPADFLIDEEQQMVFSYGWGTLSFADVKDHRTRLFADPKYNSRFRQVANLLDVTEMNFTSDQIWTLAIETVLSPWSPRAIVAPQKHFGLARMFHGHSERQNILVFRELEKAVEWVKIPFDAAVKAFDKIRQKHALA